MLIEESDTAWDAVGQFDSSGGVIKRKVGAETAFYVPENLWASCKSAANLGLGSFDIWVINNLPLDVRSWYMSLPSNIRDCHRQAALGLS
mgnify:CR=1 FL=1